MPTPVIIRFPIKGWMVPEASAKLQYVHPSAFPEGQAAYWLSVLPKAAQRSQVCSRSCNLFSLGWMTGERNTWTSNAWKQLHTCHPSSLTFATEEKTTGWQLPGLEIHFLLYYLWWEVLWWCLPHVLLSLFHIISLNGMPPILHINMRFVVMIISVH